MSKLMDKSDHLIGQYISRGRPSHNDPIHYQSKQHKYIEPLCRNGSWHIKVTEDKRLVTCNQCLDKMT